MLVVMDQIHAAFAAAGGTGDEAVLAAQLRAATEAWPELAVAPERFASELGRRLPPGIALTAIKATDVYVAVACIDRDEAAIVAVRQILAKEVAIAASKTTATRDQVADVTASLARVLFVDEPDRPAALRDYSGRGDLKSYLRVIAMRELVRVVNRGRREVNLEDDDLLDRIVPASDPELSILRAQYREIVDASMRAALGRIDERGRALLRYTFIDGWTVDRVGQVYKVHRATAARWIAAVRTELGEHIRDELAGRLRVQVDEVDSIIRLVQSRIDVSLERVLRVGP